MNSLIFRTAGAKALAIGQNDITADGIAIEIFDVIGAGIAPAEVIYPQENAILAFRHPSKKGGEFDLLSSQSTGADEERRTLCGGQYPTFNPKLTWSNYGNTHNPGTG